MYHVELRQFPHNMCRFNLTEQQLRAEIVEPWAREQWIDFGERKWSPHQARLTVLEGPELGLGALSMGRGWRNAQRNCQDVTESLLDAARLAISNVADVPAATGHSSAVATAAALADELRLRADSLGLELLAALGAEAVPLRRAWELAADRNPQHAPSESLALADLAVRSLLRSGLIVLEGSPRADVDAGLSGGPDLRGVPDQPGGPDLRGVPDQPGDPDQPGLRDPAVTLGELESWVGVTPAIGVWMRRS
jgi:hypothetical protein